MMLKALYTTANLKWELEILWILFQTSTSQLLTIPNFSFGELILKEVAFMM